MEKSSDYVCKECGKEAVVQDGKIIRSCNHVTTIIAKMSGTAYGVGGIRKDARN